MTNNAYKSVGKVVKIYKNLEVFVVFDSNSNLI